MIKITFVLRRRPELSCAEFQDYWRNRHAPLVQRHARALRIRRYVQCHTLPTEMNASLRSSRGALPEFDGVAELWWDDAATLAAATASPEGEAAGRELLEDERRFIDLTESALWLGEEHVFVDESNGEPAT